MQQIEIRVKGQISERWSEWLDGLAIRYVEPEETVLTGPVGVLRRSKVSTVPHG